eukprot:12860433-Alexandrium_andersonii.AAC.1
MSFARPPACHARASGGPGETTPHSDTGDPCASALRRPSSPSDWASLPAGLCRPQTRGSEARIPKRHACPTA